MLYDGACGVCARSVAFLRARDGAGRLRFLRLQDPEAAAILAPRGRDAARLDTSYVLAFPGAPRERLLDRSQAALFALSALSGPWKAALLLGILPRPLLDAAYDAFARSRHRWGSCPAR